MIESYNALISQIRERGYAVNSQFQFSRGEGFYLQKSSLEEPSFYIEEFLWLLGSSSHLNLLSKRDTIYHQWAYKNYLEGTTTLYKFSAFGKKKEISSNARNQMLSVRIDPKHDLKEISFLEGNYFFTQYTYEEFLEILYQENSPFTHNWGQLPVLHGGLFKELIYTAKLRGGGEIGKKLNQLQECLSLISDDKSPYPRFYTFLGRDLAVERNHNLDPKKFFNPSISLLLDEMDFFQRVTTCSTIRQKDFQEYDPSIEEILDAMDFPKRSLEIIFHFQASDLLDFSKNLFFTHLFHDFLINKFNLFSQKFFISFDFISASVPYSEDEIQLGEKEFHLKMVDCSKINDFSEFKNGQVAVI